jgi:hypothetical protein
MHTKTKKAAEKSLGEIIRGLGPFLPKTGRIPKESFPEWGLSGTSKKSTEKEAKSSRHFSL